jgi:hypothetical protein
VGRYVDFLALEKALHRVLEPFEANTTFSAVNTLGA